MKGCIYVVPVHFVNLSSLFLLVFLERKLLLLALRIQSRNIRLSVIT